MKIQVTGYTNAFFVLIPIQVMFVSYQGRHFRYPTLDLYLDPNRDMDLNLNLNLYPTLSLCSGLNMNMYTVAIVVKRL